MSLSLREQLQATLEGTYLGRRDIAIARLTEAFQSPAGLGAVSRPMLRVDPSWAPLRGNPGFERLIAERD